MIPNKISIKLIKEVFYQHISRLEYHSKEYKEDTKQNKTEINKSNHKFRRDLYDLVKRHPTTYFVTEKALEDYPDNYKSSKNLISEHPLRPSSYLFDLFNLSKYRDKYLNNFELFNNVIQCSTIIVRAFKDENEYLKSFNQLAILKCTTKDLYKEAKIKVFEINKDCFLKDYSTPAFNLLPKEAQEDLTDLELTIISEQSK
jgi:hypothetical protein